MVNDTQQMKVINMYVELMIVLSIMIQLNFIKLLLFNKKCKHDMDIKAKSTAFYLLQRDKKVPFELRNLIKDYLKNI